MAYGDQPALIAELVDWARATGFKVVCAGKGTKHLPEYRTCENWPFERFRQSSFKFRISHARHCLGLLGLY
jgi:predicted homoserine dehydrogenase-like protein